MSVSGTIAAGNLTCTNRIVGKIFAIVESDVDIMYIDKYLAKFPQDGEFARNLTVGSKISAVTAEISLALKTKDLLVESALETGTALVNGMLQVEGSTWLKGGLTVQGASSVNGALTVNGNLSGYALSGTSLNVGVGGITGGAISGSSGNFAGGSVTAGTFIGALSGNATSATNATNATNATYAATAGYATTAGHAATADALTGGGSGLGIKLSTAFSGQTVRASKTAKLTSITIDTPGYYLLGFSCFARTASGGNPLIQLDGTNMFFLDVNAPDARNDTLCGCFHTYLSAKTVYLTCNNSVGTGNVDIYVSTLYAIPV
jgi:hypothetical protein